MVNSKSYLLQSSVRLSMKFCFYFILDLRDLFEKVGLGKYLSIFQEQEVRHTKAKFSAIGCEYFMF